VLLNFRKFCHFLCITERVRNSLNTGSFFYKVRQSSVLWGTERMRVVAVLLWDCQSAGK